MASRDYLRGYDVYWQNDDFRHAICLNVLSGHISRQLRASKTVTTPASHEVQIVFDDEPETLKLFARHPKTNWLYWNPDFPVEEPIWRSGDNIAIGETSIELAQKLQSKLRNEPDLVSDFPHHAIEKAIDQFRSEDYSVSGQLGQTRKISASALTARLFFKMTCIETTVSIGFYQRRTELHRRHLISFKGGDWGAMKSLGGIHIYNAKLSLYCVDFTQSPPVIEYEKLPAVVREHLPTNSEIEKAWETGPDPMGRYLSGI